MKEENSTPRRREEPQAGLFQVLAPFLILAAILAGLILLLGEDAPQTDDPSLSQTTGQTTGATSGTAFGQTTGQTTGETAFETTQPTRGKLATATIGATGDILLHDRVIASGLDKSTGEYNYDNIFADFAPYVSAVDYGVANLEVTLCGSDNGYKYAGYPCFNSPDAIVDSLKTAGFDMLLTANNHSYDTRFTGFIRTQQVIADRGLAHIGTRPDTETPTFRVEDINGIKIGMSCYTYETGKNSSGNKTLNGINLSAEASKLINSFDYNDLDSFYDQVEEEIAHMEAAGAEAVVLFLHWGSEYKTSPNKNQIKMAQALCNLGVDVIVGNHAHVVQPVELLTSETDPDHKTLCLYSLGNSVSNIRTEDKGIPHTEDGMLFTFTFAKYSDGTVLVESADVLPLWVNLHTSGETGKEVFQILPLDKEREDWKTAFRINNTTLALAEDAWERTDEIVSEGLETANAYFAQQQEAHEALLKTQ